MEIVEGLCFFNEKKKTSKECNSILLFRCFVSIFYVSLLIVCLFCVQGAAKTCVINSIMLKNSGISAHFCLCF